MHSYYIFEDINFFFGGGGVFAFYIVTCTYKQQNELTDFEI